MEAEWQGSSLVKFMSQHPQAWNEAVKEVSGCGVREDIQQIIQLVNDEDRI